MPRIGTYDKLSVNWLYREFPEGVDERAALNEIVLQGIDDGLVFMMHTNNNFIGAAHPGASVWDNGANLVDHLKLEIDVREIGLEKFGTDVIRTGEPLSDLEYVLMPLYMHHRFQLRSAAQTIGGADYRYALKGDGQTPFAIIPAEEQRDALETILSTLTVDFLTLPEDVVSMIPPPAYRHDEGEVFPGYTGIIFDPVGAAEAAADFAVGEILHPNRMARLLVFGSMGDYPGLEEVADRLIEHTWGADAAPDAYRQRVLHAIQRSVADRMMQQASPGRKRRRSARRARRPARGVGHGPGGDGGPVAPPAPGGRGHPPLAAAHREHGPRRRAGDAAGRPDRREQPGRWAAAVRVAARPGRGAMIA